MVWVYWMGRELFFFSFQLGLTSEGAHSLDEDTVHFTLLCDEVED
jgi:hypothetical protein